MIDKKTFGLLTLGTALSLDSGDAAAGRFENLEAEQPLYTEGILVDNTRFILDSNQDVESDAAAVIAEREGYTVLWESLYFNLEINAVREDSNGAIYTVLLELEHPDYRDGHPACFQIDSYQGDCRLPDPVEIVDGGYRVVSSPPACYKVPQATKPYLGPCDEIKREFINPTVPAKDLSGFLEYHADKIDYELHEYSQHDVENEAEKYMENLSDLIIYAQLIKETAETDFRANREELISAFDLFYPIVSKFVVRRSELLDVRLCECSIPFQSKFREHSAQQLLELDSLMKRIFMILAEKVDYHFEKIEWDEDTLLPTSAVYRHSDGRLYRLKFDDNGKTSFVTKDRSHIVLLTWTGEKFEKSEFVYAHRKKLLF